MPLSNRQKEEKEYCYVLTEEKVGITLPLSNLILSETLIIFLYSKDRLYNQKALLSPPF